jgi:multiple sugar transport system permease protein
MATTGATTGPLAGQAAQEQTGARTRARRRGNPDIDRGKNIALWVFTILIMLFCLFPFYWVINVSLKTGPDLSRPDIFPPNPTFANYASIFQNGDFTRALLNSVVVSFSTTILSLVIGAFAAYALARLRFPRKFLILAIILSISTFPPIAIAAPVFKLFTDIGLYNTYLGLILPSLTFALPLTIYILTSFFKEIPKELEEAALVDGASNFTAFRKVVIPLAAPGMVTAGMLVFIAAWTEFLFAITLTSTPQARTVPAAIAFFTGSQQFEQPLGTISAASVVVTLPLIALVLIFQKRIVAGLTAGAVKG